MTLTDDDISARHMSSYVNAMTQYSARRGRQADLVGAASGYGGYSYCPTGIPVELALCLLLAGFAVAFGILYRAVTLKTMGRRKRRAETDIGSLEDVQQRVSDLIWWGTSFYHYPGTFFVRCNKKYISCISLVELDAVKDLSASGNWIVVQNFSFY
jgi:hypothetical protein